MKTTQNYKFNYISGALFGSRYDKPFFIMILATNTTSSEILWIEKGKIVNYTFSKVWLDTMLACL